MQYYGYYGNFVSNASLHLDGGFNLPQMMEFINEKDCPIYYGK